MSPILIFRYLECTKGDRAAAKSRSKKLRKHKMFMRRRKMKTNGLLRKAKKDKKDEFYTQYETIEKEIQYYSDFLHGKNIYCNCDDPNRSAFWKYFSDNFCRFGLKSLVSTYLTNGKTFIKTEMKTNREGKTEVTKKRLNGSGSYSSDECVRILAQPDTVVVTNPPFSLTKHFIPLMYRHNVPFLILGNQNTLTFRDVYPHILKGDLRLGVSIHAGDVEFEIPSDYSAAGSNTTERNGKKYARVTGIRWLTNIDHRYYPEPMKLNTMSWNLKHNTVLLKKLNERYGVTKYPSYSNYDAIEVPLTNAIPSDYSGTFGIPITFLDKFNPRQFSFVGFRKGTDGKDLNINGKSTFFRFLVRLNSEVNL